MSATFLNRPTTVEINLDELARNFHSAKAFIGQDARVMAVVKANAYGHGAVECSRRLEKEGVNWLAVAIPEEGIELRKAGIGCPILVLGGFWPGQESLILEYGLTPAIFDMRAAGLLDRAAKEKGITVNCHIKIDTGMGRVGVRYDRAAEFCDEFVTFENLRVEAVMTHFAAADDLNETDFTNAQMRRFDEILSVFALRGIDPDMVDLANSPAAVAHPLSVRDLVRLGGILYGLGGDVLPSGIEKPDLRPVMALTSKISLVKTVPSGETLGYGRTFTAERDSVIATVPIGYADGFPRSLSNSGSLIVRGAFAPIVGRVSMDWTLIDVTDVPDVRVDDDVIVIGSSGGLSINAEDIARLSGTISYEVTCGISSRIHRVFDPMN